MGWGVGGGPSQWRRVTGTQTYGWRGLQTEQVLALGSSRFGEQIRHKPQGAAPVERREGPAVHQEQPQECWGLGASSLRVRRAVPALPSGLPFQGLEEKERGPLLGAPTCERTKERPVDIMIYLCYLTNPFIALSARHHAKPFSNIHSRNLHSNPREGLLLPPFYRGGD